MNDAPSKPGIKHLVLHPAPDCPGHELWQRDFTGSSSVFPVVFRPTWDPAHVIRFVEALKLFRLGFSWGGTHSLAMAYPPLPQKQPSYNGRIVRLNVGLEKTADLIADLEQA